MRIVAWNVGHQARLKPVKPDFGKAIKSLGPDVLILNEYVHGQTRAAFVNELRQCGLGTWEVSVPIGTNNQVLLASRHAFELGELRGVPTLSGGGESNFLHVVLPTEELEIVGMRVPAYRGSALKDYWRRFDRLVRALRGRRIVFCGDLNADPDGKTSAGKSILTKLRTDGWHIPSPIGEGSYKSGTRIDHAISSPGLPIASAEYCAERDGLVLCDSTKPSICDHTPIIVEV